MKNILPLFAIASNNIVTKMSGDKSINNIAAQKKSASGFKKFLYKAQLSFKNLS